MADGNRELRTKLAAIGMLAMLRAEAYDNELLGMLADEGASMDAILTQGLKHEAMHGFMVGVTACVGVLDGDDPLDAFREFADLLEQKERAVLERSFSAQVERYSETGEA